MESWSEEALVKRKSALFLDVDGVLNNYTTKEKLANGITGIDPVNVANLNKIIQRVDVEIVLSSTWRLFYSLSDLNRVFKRAGFEGEIRSRTIEIMAAYNRGEEIQEWLAKHPDVTYFVILDDDNDMDHLIDHLVQIDPEVGLTETDAKKALLFLL